MRKLFIFFILLNLVRAISAQGEKSWRGLVFNESTPSSAEALFGKPRKDRLEKPKFYPAVPANVKKELGIRTLEFNKIAGFEKVALMLLNNKLRGIVSDAKKNSITGSEVKSIYGGEFLFFETLPKQTDFAQFEGQKETTVPKVYPAVYHMVSVQKDRIVIATIDNDSWKALWRAGIKKPTIELFPGYVQRVHILSREPVVE